MYGYFLLFFNQSTYFTYRNNEVFKYKKNNKLNEQIVFEIVLLNHVYIVSSNGRLLRLLTILF